MKTLDKTVLGQDRITLSADEELAIRLPSGKIVDIHVNERGTAAFVYLHEADGELAVSAIDYHGEDRFDSRIISNREGL